jgi:hypothetical protein
MLKYQFLLIVTNTVTNKVYEVAKLKSFDDALFMKDSFQEAVKNQPLIYSLKPFTN